MNEPRDTPCTVADLEAVLATPGKNTVAALNDISGDIVVLGAGGKIGPTIARMAQRAIADSTNQTRQVIAVSRFTSDAAQRSLIEAGIETIRCDVSSRAEVEKLPEAGAVVYLVGKKFGTRGDPGDTWVQNVIAPDICTGRYARTPLVALSTGNVYPLVDATGAGCSEDVPPAPVGEYAASCLGRERVLTNRSKQDGTPIVIVRLNYAVELRYGVLTDLATKIRDGHEIDLSMGYVNIIWQGDACRAILELLPHAASPPLFVNVTGSGHLAVRELALQLGDRLRMEPRFVGCEAKDALLSDANLMTDLVGEPQTTLTTMLDWVAAWILEDRPLLGKATHFQIRDGSF